MSHLPGVPTPEGQEDKGTLCLLLGFAVNLKLLRIFSNQEKRKAERRVGTATGRGLSSHLAFTMEAGTRAQGG